MRGAERKSKRILLEKSELTFALEQFCFCFSRAAHCDETLAACSRGRRSTEPPRRRAGPSAPDGGRSGRRSPAHLVNLEIFFSRIFVFVGALGTLLTPALDPTLRISRRRRRRRSLCLAELKKVTPRSVQAQRQGKLARNSPH